MLFNTYFNIQKRTIQKEQEASAETQGKWVGSREKARRAKAEEPLGTDFHQIIFNNWSECRLLIRDKMFSIFVPKPRTAYLEFFSCVRTRRLLSRHTCQLRSLRLCVLIFPNQKRRNCWWLRKTFRMLSAATFQFALTPLAWVILTQLWTTRPRQCWKANSWQSFRCNH